MTKLEKFLEELETHYVKVEIDPDDPFCNERYNQCRLRYKHDNGTIHAFDVRRWKKEIKDGELHISVVNWTLCAGPAGLYLTDEDVDKYEIMDKSWYPTDKERVYEREIARIEREERGEEARKRLKATGYDV